MPAHRELQWGRDVLVADVVLVGALNGGTSVLQWGRDVLVADVVRSWLTPSVDALLQWGRDVLVADVVRGGAREAPSAARFNGAATF